MPAGAAGVDREGAVAAAIEGAGEAAARADREERRLVGWADQVGHAGESVGTDRALVETGDGPVGVGGRADERVGAAALDAGHARERHLHGTVNLAAAGPTIEAMIAKGASGVIFRARDTTDDELVALKVLQPEFAASDEDMRRFIRAMKTVLPLRHPNLVSLHKAGKTANSCLVAMDLVEGESMAQVIRRIGVAGMLDWRYGYRVAVHIASLAAALGGLDGVVFTAGVGENAAPVRSGICRACAWLGLELDEAANREHRQRISTSSSRVAAYVIKTDENLMIARHAHRLVAG